MRIGYACLAVNVPHTKIRRCLLKNASEERLLELIDHNLYALENLLDYNFQNGIQLFRICSELIPFGSSPVNRVHWWRIFSHRFLSIGEKIKEFDMRVSMHPGQYTVFNAEKEEIASKAFDDLFYHNRVLDSFGLGPEHKIILHIGGIYHDRVRSMKRFITNFRHLDNSICNRLVIENDDKCYPISDVLRIAEEIATPVIFDNLHHNVNPGKEKKNSIEWIEICRKTWLEKDGIQKIHYSQQAPGKNPGSHSKTIELNEFMDFFQTIRHMNLDIMLEVKDKNLSAIKCMQALKQSNNIPFP